MNRTTIRDLSPEVLFMVLGYLNEHALAQLAVTSKRMHAAVTPVLYDQVTLDDQAIEDVIEAHGLPAASNHHTPFRHTTSLNLAQKATCRMLPVLGACGDKLEYLTIRGTFVDKKQCSELLDHLKACNKLRVLEVSGVYDTVLFDIVKHTTSLETLRIGTVFDSKTSRSDSRDRFTLERSNICSLELERPMLFGRSYELVRHLVQLLAPNLINLNSARELRTRLSLNLRLGYHSDFRNLRTLVLEEEPYDNVIAILKTARQLTKLLVCLPFEQLYVDQDAPRSGRSVVEYIPSTIEHLEISNLCWVRDPPDILGSFVRNAKALKTLPVVLVLGCVGILEPPHAVSHALEDERRKTLQHLAETGLTWKAEVEELFMTEGVPTSYYDAQCNRKGFQI